MSSAYIDAVQRGAPQAQIICDRLHIRLLAQDAVDQEQIRLLAEAPEKTRWALLKNPWNLTVVKDEKLA